MSPRRTASLSSQSARSRRLLGPIFGAACLVATCTGVVVLALLLGSIVVGGAPGTARPSRGMRSAPTSPSWSALVRRLAAASQSIDPALAGYPGRDRRAASGCLGLVALIGIPIGVGAGVYLEEYAPPGRLRRIIQTNIANLAGVPSIVYGILGLALFVRAFGIKALALGPTLLAGVLTLSLLILPIIVITTQEALRAVPHSLRQAALALGATRWQMVRDHVLPVGAAGHPDRHDPRPVARDRRDRPAAHGRRGRLDPPASQGPARSLLGPARSRSTITPRSRTREFQTVAAGGILILVTLLLLDERHRHRDSQPLPTLSLERTSPMIPIARTRCRTLPASFTRPLMSVSETRADRAAESARRGACVRREHLATDPIVLSTRGLSVWYGPRLALKDITIDIPRNKITALIGPSGCGKSTLLRCFNRMNDLITGLAHGGRGPLRRRADLRRRHRPRRPAAADRHGLSEAEPVPQEHLQQRRLGCADQRLSRRHGRAGRAVAPPRGPVGRGEDQAEPLRAGALRRPAATALHRPDARRRARGHPDGRALLGARPDLDRPRRRPDGRPQGRLHDRHRHPQHAASPPRQRHDRLPHARRGVRPTAIAPASSPSSARPTSSSPTPRTSAPRPTSPGASADARSGRTP